MAEYTLTPRAEVDLEDIWDYSATAWSTAQADSYIDELVITFEALADAPLQAAPCDDIRAGYRYARAAKHVVYFVNAGLALKLSGYSMSVCCRVGTSNPLPCCPAARRTALQAKG